MKKIIIFLLFSLFIIVLLLIGLYNRWNYMWSKEPSKPFYAVTYHRDDTLRVVMIGDSWAVGHQQFSRDSFFQASLSNKLGRPVIFKSKGKGGENSRGIYRLLFENGIFGTRQLFSHAPDYCIIMAGINDAASNLGVDQFCYHYRLILDFLLKLQVRPIIIEIPDVDISHLYGAKPLKDLIVDFIRSKMTGCSMYHYAEYRDALFQMLVDDNMQDSVVFVRMDGWNQTSPAIDGKIFECDRVHLNKEGYEQLDSCIVSSIILDLQ